MATKQVMVTKKRREEVILPGDTYIYQSNRVTNGSFPDFNIYHSKIFVCIIKNLQKAITAEINGQDWRQLNIFEETEGGNFLKIGIPLSEIASHNNYKQVLECFEGLRTFPITIESPVGKQYDRITGLITEYDRPKRIHGKSVVFVNMRKQVAEQLIQISKNKLGAPVLFTRYLYEVVMSARNKYTWRIYTLISSWKKKGGFYISLEQFREILGLKADEYKSYADIKRFILKPAQDELDHKADCWFNCAEKDFEQKEGRRVTGFYFKVITPELSDTRQLKADNISELLRRHCGFKNDDIDEIKEILTPYADLDAIIIKIMQLLEYVKERKADIGNPRQYIKLTLLKMFKPKNNV